MVQQAGVRIGDRSIQLSPQDTMGPLLLCASYLSVCKYIHIAIHVIIGSIFSESDSKVSKISKDLYSQESELLPRLP